jgi:ankyrin repeat protein
MLNIPFSHSRYCSDQAFQSSSTTVAQDLLSTNTVEDLIAAGANLDVFDCSNRTASYWAAHIGRHYVAELLILQGASIQAVDHNQRTPLHV